MRRLGSGLILALAVLAFAPEAQALTPVGNNTLRNIQGRLPQLQKDPKLFDGAALVPGARRDVAQNFLNRFKSNLGPMISQLNRLPPADRADPQVKAVEAQLNELSAYAAAFEKALGENVQAAKGADDTCRAFEKEAMGLDNRDKMINLVKLAAFPESVTMHAPEIVKGYKDAAGRVAAVCAQEKYKDVGKSGCAWMKIGGNDRNPDAWCAAAGKADELIKQGVKNHIAHHTGVFAGLGTKPAELERKEGWLEVEGPATYNETLFYTEADKARLMAKMKPLLEAAGITDIADDALYAKFKEAKDALRAKVDELAPTWKSPPGEGGHYGAEMAKKQIKQWHPKAAVKSAYVKHQAWTIVTNKLGIPLHRSVPGIIVFEIPGDKWCQARGFVVTEDYSGSGTYQKPSGVRIGYARFQQECK